MSETPTPDELPDELLTPDQRRDKTDGQNPGDRARSPIEPDTSTDDESVREKLAVDDHREFVERERLKDIIQAQRDVREKIREAPIRAASSDRANADHFMNQAVQGAVWTLVEQLRGQLQRTDVGARYWKNSEIGSFPLPDPDVPNGGHAKSYKLTDLDVRGVPGRMVRVDGAVPHISVNGLSEFLELPTEFPVKYRFDKDSHSLTKPGGTETVGYSVSPPLRLSRSAFETVNEFLADVGLDVQIDDSTQATIDFDEV